MLIVKMESFQAKQQVMGYGGRRTRVKENLKKKMEVLRFSQVRRDSG